MLKKFLGGGNSTNSYSAPNVEICEVKTEKGFAYSFEKEEEDF